MAKLRNKIWPTRSASRAKRSTQSSRENTLRRWKPHLELPRPSTRRSKVYSTIPRTEFFVGRDPGSVRKGDRFNSSVPRLMAGSMWFRGYLLVILEHHNDGGLLGVTDARDDTDGSGMDLRRTARANDSGRYAQIGRASCRER